MYETNATFGSLNAEPHDVAKVTPMRSLAHLVYRRRWVVIGIWIVLTVFGAFSAGQVSKRWFESFSIPG